MVHADGQAVRILELGGVGGHVEGAQDLRGRKGRGRIERTRPGPAGEKSSAKARALARAQQAQLPGLGWLPKSAGQKVE